MEVMCLKKRNILTMIIVFFLFMPPFGTHIFAPDVAAGRHKVALTPAGTLAHGNIPNGATNTPEASFISAKSVGIRTEVSPRNRQLRYYIQTLRAA